MLNNDRGRLGNSKWRMGDVIPQPLLSHCPQAYDLESFRLFWDGLVEDKELADGNIQGGRNPVASFNRRGIDTPFDKT